MLSERVDSAQLAELAKKGFGQVVSLPVVDFARLSACLYQAGGDQSGTDQDSAELALNVKFDVGPEGFPRVAISVTGCLSLSCQRCLEPMAWPVRIETRLSVLDSDEQTELIASPFDSILMNADGLDIATVIEDEILAALPIALVHRDGPGCQSAGGDESNSTIEAELMQRPFADLANIVGGRKSNVDD
ncbi:MAG: YceD family protein [Gammaproteobacteria bacterium]|jgi:uncharacterized protein|nr:hypothetical protein [Chromatiales bacterium]MDP6674307.1 YceD family protein [Gammaproteobacteria bacterium]